jgi:hypothetical protein
LTNLYDLQVDDLVVVHAGMTRGRNTFSGTVVKKGRKLITIQPEGTNAEHLQLVFRLEDGNYNNKDYSHRYIVYTTDEWDERRRRADLVKFLDDKGVRLTNTFISIDIMERLAEVLKGEMPGDNGSLD